jgi:uncharacterized protein YbjT (DUF2867 family)
MKAVGFSVIMIGATGAVGGHVARALAGMPDVKRLTLLGRRPRADLSGHGIQQHIVDVLNVASYERFLPGHEVAICTLGVGQPSRISMSDFVAIDKSAVLAFASSCKAAGIRHFELLGSVGADPRSRSFYLRTKGELEDGLRALSFERLSLFRPSMILTPTNRYGLSQALTLVVWPWLRPLLAGGLRKYRGIEVERLGQAMAADTRRQGRGVEILHWDAIDALAREVDGQG